MGLSVVDMLPVVDMRYFDIDYVDLPYYFLEMDYGCCFESLKNTFETVVLQDYG
jgi:hypothetical protein